MLKVFGQCYEIRERLKGLGCVWNAGEDAWFAPDDAHAQAQALADAENRRVWLAYCNCADLAWVKGSLTPSIWNASLRAASLKIPPAECYALCEARVRGAGAAVKPSRIERDVRRAYESVGDIADCGLRIADRKAEKQERPHFKNEKLSQVAGVLANEIDLAWLAARSPLDPFTVTPHDFLCALYEPGERVVVLDVFKSQGAWLWGAEEGFERGEMDWDNWHDRAQPPELKAAREFDARGPEGIWYLCNPVDGVFRPTGENDDAGRPKWSRRFEQCVTRWRYIVLESDQAAARDWVAMAVQLPLRISAIYTSGGKSVHVLVRLDARTIEQWREWREEIAPILVTLGACLPSMSAVRLTRLPQCRRGGALQKLLYLNPAPDMTPILFRRPLRDAVTAWITLAESIVLTEPGEVDPAKAARCVEALEFYRCTEEAAAVKHFLKAVRR